METGTILWRQLNSFSYRELKYFSLLHLKCILAFRGVRSNGLIPPALHTHSNEAQWSFLCDLDGLSQQIDYRKLCSPLET